MTKPRALHCGVVDVCEIHYAIEQINLSVTKMNERERRISEFPAANGVFPRGLISGEAQGEHGNGTRRRGAPLEDEEKSEAKRGN